MKVRITITAIFMLLFSVMSFAQSNTLTGKVIDGENAPIPGVAVKIVGTSTGAYTDDNGNYSVKVNRGDSIRFSFIGFATQTIAYTGQLSLDVNLSETTFDEVVVVAYGTQKKSHNTGAIGSLKGKDLVAIQSTRVDEALAGKLAGVLIQNQNPEPGAAPKVQVRAASSLSGDSGPLIIVDGYQISGNLATINPNDIESIEVLKDAASAAIYGANGANGVILVTTKKGQAGKTQFGYNTYTSLSQKYRKNILMSGPEWAAFSRQEIAAGNWDLSQVDPAFVEYRLSAYENSPGAISPEDWLFQNGFSQNHNFNMRGGTEKARYYGSVGYQNNEGVAITQGFERFNARLNLDMNLTDKLTAGISFNGFVSKRDILAHDMRDLLRAYGVHPVYHTQESIDFVQGLNSEALALGLDPFDDGYRGGVGPSSIFDLQVGDRVDDWHYGRENNGIGGSGDAGPAQKLDNAERWQKTYYANLVGYLQYEIIDGLTLRTAFGGDMNNTEDYYYQGLAADSRARADQTDLDLWTRNATSFMNTTTLTYNKRLDKHTINAVAGGEFLNNNISGFSMIGTNVPYSDIVNFNLLDPADILVSETKAVRNRRSLFARAQYAFDNRYLFSASIRRDGDSRFGANKQFGVFPSVSAGWNIYNEKFWNIDAINLFKVRVSTGLLGTSSFLNDYDAQSLLNPTTTIFGTGFGISGNINNPDLTWQTNRETNFGIDVGILKSRFVLGANYYISDIQNMILGNSVSYTTVGQPSYINNTGDMRSTGVELELIARVIRKKDFRWDINANISTVNTEITALGNVDELPQEQYGQSGRGPVFRNYIGGEIGEMWGLQTIGEVEMQYLEDPTRHPNNSTGESYVVDQNDDGVIDEKDYVKIGQSTPDFYWGLGTTMNYKSFDLSMQWQGSHGAEVYNIDPLYLESQWSGRLVDSFDADGDGIADHNSQHYIGNRRQTDAGIQDASYVALRNITLGYTFDGDWFRKVGLSQFRIYAAATNLLYIMGSNYTSYNPEGVETGNTGYLGPTTYGVQVGASPIVRSFTFGLNVNF
jgi:TonB-dependent starch-binding outer membrane protein SusC